MRTYQVWMTSTATGASHCVEVRADDVDLDAKGETAFWNFIGRSDGHDDVTVAAFPFLNVEYILSKPEELSGRDYTPALSFFASDDTRRNLNAG